MRVNVLFHSPAILVASVNQMAAFGMPKLRFAWSFSRDWSLREDCMNVACCHKDMGFAVELYDLTFDN